MSEPQITHGAPVEVVATAEDGSEASAPRIPLTGRDIGQPRPHDPERRWLKL